jgi:hypothetical protein
MPEREQCSPTRLAKRGASRGSGRHHPCSCIYVWSNATVLAMRGTIRRCRPLPVNCTCAGLASRTARGERAISSCPRAPVSYRRRRSTASRRPVRVVRSGCWRIAATASGARYPTTGGASLWLGRARICCHGSS